MKTRILSYQVLVYIAYGFYFLLGLSWFIISFLNGNSFNATAFFILAIFGVQMYYKHLLTNLIMGILSLLLSIFMLLQALSSVLPAAKKGQLALFDKLIVAMPVVSIFMAGILIFSFLKLNFKD